MNFHSPSPSLDGRNLTNQSLFDCQSESPLSGPLSFDDQELIASPHYSSISSSSSAENLLLPPVAQQQPKQQEQQQRMKIANNNRPPPININSATNRSASVVAVVGGGNKKNAYDEVDWRDEKIEWMEQERTKRIEEFTKQKIQLVEEINKLNTTLNQSSTTINGGGAGVAGGTETKVQLNQQQQQQLQHEKQLIQEYAEQLRLQKNALQAELNFYKQGAVNQELEKRNQQVMHLEGISNGMKEELQRTHLELTKCQNENDRLKEELNTLKITFNHKNAECEEMIIMQDELLRTIAQDKKTVFEFQKLQFNENLAKEKLKKENEKLELLVEKLKGENKEGQEEMVKKRELFKLELEERERKHEKEVTNLHSIIDRMKAESRDTESFYQAQQLSSQELLASLSQQLKDQQDKMEAMIQSRAREKIEENQQFQEKSKRYQKELYSSLEMIKLLKQANTNLETNFLKNSQIILNLEQALSKERIEKAELAENVEILKVKLPQMFETQMEEY